MLVVCAASSVPDRVLSSDRFLYSPACRRLANTEITPEIAGALAAEAERGYDLSKAKRRRVGRPSLAGRGASPRLSFRTTPDLYRAARKRAKQEGRSVSDLAREAVARYVKS